jgi:hypothetical protein
VEVKKRKMEKMWYKMRGSLQQIEETEHAYRVWSQSDMRMDVCSRAAEQNFASQGT